jgi:hypothetical protein
MAVYKNAKSFITFIHGGKLKKTVVIYHGILTLENVERAVNYSGIFITLVSSVNITKPLAL